MKFYNICEADVDNHFDLFSSMHRLRWNIFYRKKQWRDGLTVFNGMEHDEYDNANAHYVVSTDANGKVNMSARLIQTTNPYMIGDHFPDFISDGSIPHQKNIWELTRFCCDTAPPGMSNMTMSGYLTAAILEFGIAHGVDRFIAITNTSVKTMIERTGWDPQPIGKTELTGDGKPSVACLYSSGLKILNHIRRRHNISSDLLYRPDYPNRSVLQTMYQNTAANDSFCPFPVQKKFSIAS